MEFGIYVWQRGCETAKGIHKQFMKCGWCYKTVVPLNAFMYVKSAICGNVSVI